MPTGDLFAWDPFSTYVRKPPYFEGMTLEISDPRDIRGARALGVFGDSVTTDHISPAGEIVRKSPAGHYLTENDVPVAEYNTFGARRGNHEVMGRGTFGNIRLRNRLVPGVEGWFTKHLPDGEEMSIWDASEKYQAEGVPLIILGGKEYGTGSSRDWAAKGPKILGVKAVIVESFERIHRSNLIGMGILPLQFERRPVGREPRPHRRRGLRHRGHRGGWPDAAPAPQGHRHGAGRQREDIPRRQPHRHADRGRLLQARRHPALRAAPACEELDDKLP